MTVLLHSDFVYASNEIALRLPFLDLGLVPEFASTLLLPRLVGFQKACELLMLGKDLPAEKAVQLGLVNEMMPGDQLLAYAEKICSELAEKPTNVLSATKRLLKSRLMAQTISTIEEETIELSKLLKSEPFNKRRNFKK